MGLFDTIGKAVKNFDYEGAVDYLNNEAERVQNNALTKYKNDIRKMSDDRLESMLRRYDEEGKYDVARDALEEEMSRRGIL